MPITFFPDPKQLLFSFVEESLVLHRDGQSVTLAPPKRALPLSDPNRFIAFYDEQGNELGILRDVAELEPDSRTALEQALERYYAIRHISRILELRKEPASGETIWLAEVVPDENVDPICARKERCSHNGKNGDGKHSNGAKGNGTRGGSVLTIATGNNLLRKFNLPSRNGNSATHAKHDSNRNTVEVEFAVSGPESVQTARYPYIYIVDTDGCRYDILDCDELDLDSRRAAEGFL